MISWLHRQHRTIEFKKFQAKIDATVPADLHVHLIDGIRDGSEFQSEVSSRDTGSNSCVKLTEDVPRSVELGQRSGDHQVAVTLSL